MVGKENVIGIARTPQNAEHLKVAIRKGDYNHRDQFDEALKGVDRVLLVSGMDAPDKRIQQHRNVIEAAKQNGVKKIVYTSIVGDEARTSFSGIVKSNRQTEKDIQQSGLAWEIGRNGIYIEPDMEYLDTYIKEGEVRNCAGEGKCGYTSREELGHAYAQMLVNDKYNGQTNNLAGEAITQTELVKLINHVFNTELKYKPVTVSAYQKERKAALGEFMGNIIAGIYEGIKMGAFEVEADFEKVVGRPHHSPLALISSFYEQNKGAQ
ncbi:NAD(P)H-binding protein [Echinicola strongylocentroti]|uniref:NAD(P)H-binding protein n=1 Tax=Echinicola strongylocentroti TaxID=1795355 RepID=UPI001FE96C69|nr:NAD(P)H-binding protein [Echinicola strongylocentroti]